MEIQVNLYSIFREHLSVEDTNEWIYWKSDGTFPNIPYYIRAGSAAIFICREGSIELEINLKTHHFTAGKVVCLLPEHILYIKEISADFVGCGFIAGEKFWKEARREVENMNPFYITVRDFPCIPVEMQQSELLLRYLDIFREKYRSPRTSHNRIIVRKLFTILLYEIYHLYVGVIGQLPQPDKKEKMFQEFLKLLAANFRKEKGVGFYADYFQVTTRYFSNVIKEISQASAAEWIDNYIVAEAKVLLRTTTLSIKEISEELNFPDQSFFGKYFKRNTGISPKEYRML